MFKKARRMVIVSAAAFLMAAAPAQAGWIVFYYSDYPGGTIVGYDWRCSDMSVYQQWGDLSAIPDVEWYIETPC
jgi:hypothetical protein